MHGQSSPYKQHDSYINHQSRTSLISEQGTLVFRTLNQLEHKLETMKADIEQTSIRSIN